MITETAEVRYEQLLKTNPEIFQHAPLKHIASYLGITDTSLSRIRKNCQKMTPLYFLPFVRCRQIYCSSFAHK